jgi:hypothetical protein
MAGYGNLTLHSKKFNTYDKCLHMFTHLPTSTRLTKVKLICQRLHIWQKWDSSTSAVCQFTHLSTSTHLTKVRLLDFRRLSVYTSGNVYTSDKTETPRFPHSVCLRICARHLRASTRLAKVRLLDCRRLFVYTCVNVYTSGKSETPRLRPFVSFTHLSTSTHLTKVRLLDCRRLSVYTSGNVHTSDAPQYCQAELRHDEQLD